MSDLSIQIRFESVKFFKMLGCQNVEWYFELYNKYKIDMDPLIYFFLQWQHVRSKAINYREFCRVFDMRYTNIDIPGNGDKVIEYFMRYLMSQGLCIKKVRHCYRIAESMYFDIESK